MRDSLGRPSSDIAEGSHCARVVSALGDAPDIRGVHMSRRQADASPLTPAYAVAQGSMCELRVLTPAYAGKGKVVASCHETEYDQLSGDMHSSRSLTPADAVAKGTSAPHLSQAPAYAGNGGAGQSHMNDIKREGRLTSTNDIAPEDGRVEPRPVGHDGDAIGGAGKVDQPKLFVTSSGFPTSPVQPMRPVPPSVPPSVPGPVGGHLGAPSSLRPNGTPSGSRVRLASGAPVGPCGGAPSARNSAKKGNCGCGPLCGAVDIVTGREFTRFTAQDGQQSALGTYEDLFQCIDLGLGIDSYVIISDDLEKLAQCEQMRYGDEALRPVSPNCAAVLPATHAVPEALAALSESADFASERALIFLEVANLAAAQGVMHSIKAI